MIVSLKFLGTNAYNRYAMCPAIRYIDFNYISEVSLFRLVTWSLYLAKGKICV